MPCFTLKASFIVVIVNMMSDIFTRGAVCSSIRVLVNLGISKFIRTIKFAIFSASLGCSSEECDPELH